MNYKAIFSVAGRRPLVLGCDRIDDVYGELRRLAANVFAQRAWGASANGHVDWQNLSGSECRVRRARRCHTGGIKLYGDTFMMSCDVQTIQREAVNA